MLFVIVYRHYQFAIGKQRIIIMKLLKVHRKEACHPPMAVNNIGRPAQFFYRFYYASAKENGTLIIIFKEIIILIIKGSLSLKVLLIINKINLHTRLWHRCYLDDQGLVHIVHYNIDPA